MKTEGVRRRDLGPCSKCGKGLGHSGDICSTRVVVTRLVMNLNAIQRQTGLEMMLGSAALAEVMGRNEELLVSLGDADTLLLCDDCAMNTTVMALSEIAQRDPSRPLAAKGEV